jgi:hypothetical protein
MKFTTTASIAAPSKASGSERAFTTWRMRA